MILTTLSASKVLAVNQQVQMYHLSSLVTEQGNISKKTARMLQALKGSRTGYCHYQADAVLLSKVIRYVNSVQFTAD